jgi:hypothetical protein
MITNLKLQFRIIMVALYSVRHEQTFVPGMPSNILLFNRFLQGTLYLF